MPLRPGQGECRRDVLLWLARCLAATISAEALQTVFHDDRYLSVPSLCQLSASHEDDVGRFLPIVM